MEDIRARTFSRKARSFRFVTPTLGRLVNSTSLIPLNLSSARTLVACFLERGASEP